MKALRSLWLLPSLAVVACGSRTGLQLPEEQATPAIIECMSDADCDSKEDKCTVVACQEGACAVLGALSCDDGDPCTEDSCDPATGTCKNEPLTPDLDGDGHRAPLPGFRPGEPGSCGDDCDDSNPNAFPGNVENCDGIDNDCNGIVDDGTIYVPSGDEDILVSAGMSPAMPGGISFTNGRYFAAYTARSLGMDSAYVSSIGKDASVGEPTRLNELPYQAEAGRLAWAGDRFGMAYGHRRPASNEQMSLYEIHFDTLTPEGKKLGLDISVHRAYSSFNSPPTVTFTGREFVVVWAARFGTGLLNFHVYAQRLDLEGNLLGPNVLLSLPPGDDAGSLQGPNIDNEAPQIATGRKSLGIVWTRTRSARPHVLFQSFDFELRPLMKEPVELNPHGSFGAFPTMAWNEATETYLVAYYDPIRSPHAIYGATIAEDGNVITPARPITDSPRHSRYPSLLPLGDRALLVFSDDKDENQGYELYTKMLDDKLAPLGPELRLTDAPGDSILPFTSFGPNGDIGILFRDNRAGRQQVYFSRLVCTNVNSP